MFLGTCWKHPLGTSGGPHIHSQMILNSYAKAIYFLLLADHTSISLKMISRFELFCSLRDKQPADEVEVHDFLLWIAAQRQNQQTMKALKKTFRSGP